MADPYDYLPQCVTRGLAWMDENFPKWYNHVDLDELEMSDGCKCILGQTGAQLLDTMLNIVLTKTQDDDYKLTWPSAGYVDYAMTPYDAARRILQLNAAYLGFTLSNPFGDWVRLENLWRHAIAERRGEAETLGHSVS